MCSEIVKFIKKQADIFSAEAVQSILKEGVVPARIIDEVMKGDKDTATTTTGTAPSSFQSFRKDRERMRQLKEGASSNTSNSDGVLIFWPCLFKAPHFSFFVSSSHFSGVLLHAGRERYVQSRSWLWRRITDVGNSRQTSQILHEGWNQDIEGRLCRGRRTASHVCSGLGFSLPITGRGHPQSSLGGG